MSQTTEQVAQTTILVVDDDALRAKRPYKPPFAHERAVEIITVGDGRTQPSHFDPDVLAAFSDCAGIFGDIYATHAD